MSGIFFDFGTEMSMIRDHVRIDLTDIGEGIDGDYDEEDPTDVPLFRFDVFVDETLANVNGCLNDKSFGLGIGGVEWYIPQDTSYCTQLPTDLTEAEKKMALGILMDQIYDAVLSGSPKKTCEWMSWISLLELAGLPAKGYVVSSYVKKDGKWSLG